MYTYMYTYIYIYIHIHTCASILLLPGALRLQPRLPAPLSTSISKLNNGNDNNSNEY